MTSDTAQWPYVVVCRYDENGQPLSDSSGTGKNEPDLLMVINAPGYAPALPANMVLYLDPYDSPPRNLRNNAWQLYPDRPCAPLDFQHWADEVAQLLIKVLCEPGLACIDLMDLRLLLNQSRMKQLRCMLCGWHYTRQLPESITNARYDHALAAVFASADKLSADLFNAAGHLLEEIIPAEGILLLAGRAHSAPLPRILVIYAA